LSKRGNDIADALGSFIMQFVIFLQKKRILN
jgi:hypothetical protein